MEYIQDHYQAISNVADEIFYHDISNYAVPFFYACTGYFLVAGSADGSLNGRLSIRIKKVLRLYIIWSIIYAPLTLYGWMMESNGKTFYLLLCVRNYIFVGENFYSWTLWYLNGLIFALILIKLLLKKKAARVRPVRPVKGTSPSRRKSCTKRE